MEIPKTIRAIKAVYTIRPNANFMLGETYASFTWHDGGGIDGENQNKPTEKEFNDAVTAYEAKWVTNKYARNRKEEYDVLNQFELMTDDAANSTTTHADAVEAVKTKWPKDNSGPIE